MPDRRRASQRYHRLDRAVPRLLLIAWSSAAVAAVVDVLAFLLLDSVAFSTYLLFFVLIELLLTVVAQPAALAATRSVAPLAVARASTVRLASAVLAVRSLWRVLWGRTVVALLAAGTLAVLFRYVDVPVVLTLGLAAAVFVARGRLEVDGGIVAGLLCPASALAIASLLPRVVTAAFFFAFLDLPAVSPALLYVVHLAGAAVALIAARYLLFRLAPAANAPAGVAVVAPASWASLRYWSAAAIADRALDALPLVGVLVWVDPAAAAAYALARRLAGVIDAGLIAHVVTRPAAAAGFASSVTAASRSDSTAPVLPGVARDALWFTLVPALVLAGPVVAAARPVGEVLGVPGVLFSQLVRLFVVFRILVVAAGPGAELLELGGHERTRVRLAVSWASIGVSAALLAAYYSVVVFAAVAACAARFALEAGQSRAVVTRLGIDPTVLAYLRS